MHSSPAYCSGIPRERQIPVAYQVGVVGASGYGGAELLRLLAGHPAIEVAEVAAHSQAGEPVDALYPNLTGYGTFDDVNIGRLADLDLVFLATPHGPALELGAALADAGTRVVDLSAAFRLTAPAFRTWYGEEHPRPDLAPAVYGLTEFNREAVDGATLVANPGCYPTAALLGLLPLVELIDPATVVVDGKSGTSGAGRAPKPNLHFAHVDGSVTAYGAPTHRHTGEMETWLGVLGNVPVQPLSFTPHLMPMPRGLLTTCYASVRDGVDRGTVVDALHQRYADEPFVHVLPPSTFPVTKALAGSNGAQVSGLVDERTGRVVVTTAIDNLGKGAAGQALQNANRMLGLDEPLGLTATGVYP